MYVIFVGVRFYDCLEGQVAARAGRAQELLYIKVRTIQKVFVLDNEKIILQLCDNVMGIHSASQVDKCGEETELQSNPNR
jgi:hypothetical protein